MNYSEEQLAILNESSNYQQVIAAAGSGKTFTMIALLEKIIQAKVENQEEILVITFSRKAVSEISERLEKRVGHHKIKIKTFHAYCLYILQKYHPDYVGGQAEIIEPEEKERIFKEFFQKYKYKIGGIPYDFLLNLVGNFMDKNFPELKIEIQEYYQKYKSENKKLDFDDLVSMYLDGLKYERDWAVNARKEVSRVIVDEFQDTDLTQLEWLRLLKPKILTVVGDDWQAIYGFRGASTVPFLKFPEFFQPCKVHFLRTNYRSLSEIIKVSAIPIQKNKANIPKKVLSIRKGISYVKKVIISNRIELKMFCTIFKEERSDFMVLCRSNYRIKSLQKLGVPEQNIMTIHASKGLEFGTVFLDLCAGWNLTTDSDETTKEEERRILYVGLSRAKDHLFILGNQKKDNKRIEDEFFSYFRFHTKSIDIYKLLKMTQKCVQ